MAVYQEKAKERIKGKLRTTTNIINKARQAETKEADTRTIVFDVLTDILGWDRYTEITAEYAIKGGYADYAIQIEDAKGNKRIYAVVEIKPVTTKLNDSHLRQARDYAINEGVPWVILTNGNEWQVHRIEFDKKTTIPETIHTFTVAFTDDETKPAKKADLLYLLSKEASRKDELGSHYELKQTLSGVRLSARLFAKDVIDKMRLSIKRDTGISFSNEEIAQALVCNVIRDEAMPENASACIRKLK